jgi:uncharacterized protein (DUF58 family)
MQQEQIARYKSLDFFARQVVEGFITGRHRSPLHGFSVEFSDYRQYNAGESTRNIDWRLYGRTDRLYVKQFQEETNLRCQLVVDHSASMLFPLEGQGDIEHPNKLTFSVYAAAVLIELLHRQRDAFGLTLLSDGIDRQTPCRSNAAHQQHLLAELDTLLAQQRPAANTPTTTNIAASLHLIAEQLHRRSLVVLFTDAFVDDRQRDDLFDALQHLRHNKHEVIIFHTFDRARELQLDYGSRPLRFVDLESGRTLRLQPSEVAQQYGDLMLRQQADLQQRAMQYRIDYVPVDVAQGFHQVILPFLLKRSKQ